MSTTMANSVVLESILISYDKIRQYYSTIINLGQYNTDLNSDFMYIDCNKKCKIDVSKTNQEVKVMEYNSRNSACFRSYLLNCAENVEETLADPIWGALGQVKGSVELEDLWLSVWWLVHCTMYAMCALLQWP